MFATPSYKHAAKFCGADQLFGLIHHYQKALFQIYYKSYELETGGLPQFKPNNQIETLVAPKVNPYRGLEMYMGTRSFNIPNDDERWLVFKEYHRAAYMPNSEIMKQRRINILSEANDNGGIAVCYMPVGLTEDELSLEKYLNRTTEIEDVLIELPPSIQKDYEQYRRQQQNDSFRASIQNNLQIVKQIKQQTQSSSQNPHTNNSNSPDSQARSKSSNLKVR